MTNKEFAKGLYKLADLHANDKPTVFDTDWCKVCNEAAKIIMELVTKNEELEEALKDWENWDAWKKDPKEQDLDIPEFLKPKKEEEFFDEDDILEEEEKKPKEIKVMDLKPVFKERQVVYDD